MPLIAWHGGKPLAAQTTDWSRLSVGVSVGAHFGYDLWDVVNQPIQSANHPPDTPNGHYPADTFHLHRDVPQGLVISVHATRFYNQHLGVNFEFVYASMRPRPGCQVRYFGGDTALTTACRFVGSDSIFGVGVNSGSASQSRYLSMLMAGVVLRPFRPSTLQPFANLSAGVVFTTISTVALDSYYATHVDTALALTIYVDNHDKSMWPVVAAGIGVATVPSHGLQVRVEAREMFVSQAVVTGAAPTTNAEPPNHAVFKAVPTVLFGVDFVLGKTRGKRY